MKKAMENLSIPCMYKYMSTLVAIRRTTKSIGGDVEKKIPDTIRNAKGVRNVMRHPAFALCDTTQVAYQYSTLVSKRIHKVFYKMYINSISISKQTFTSLYFTI